MRISTNIVRFVKTTSVHHSGYGKLETGGGRHALQMLHDPFKELDPQDHHDDQEKFTLAL